MNACAAMTFEASATAILVEAMAEPSAATGIAQDAVLMRNAARGDSNAWRSIVASYLSLTHSIAYRMTFDAGIADDVTQEVFLRLWKVAGHWQPKARIKTWVYQVARNLAVDAVRQRIKESPRELTEDFASSDPSPLEAIAARENSVLVNEALNRLPERQRAAILLVHYAECSGKEAAETLGLSVDALESLLARGRRTLRHLLCGATNSQEAR